MKAQIIEFPKLEKCGQCSGSGLTWSFQRRTKRAQVSSSCPACRGTGKVRNVGNQETGKEGI